MNFLIIGCGSIGRRHAKNLITLGHCVSMFDKDAEKERVAVAELGVSIYDFKSYHQHFDGWLVCCPPVLHIPFAVEALQHDSNVFIEKPLSNSLEGLDKMIILSKDNNAIVQVGYQLRFSNLLRTAKLLIDEGKIGRLLHIQLEYGNHLQNWHSHEDYRHLYTSHEDQGGGIILDSSHEIDTALWLTSSPAEKISCFSDHLSDLEIDTEDSADILLTFSNKVQANIHIDMLNHQYSRKCCVIGTDGVISLDLANNHLESSISFIKDMVAEDNNDPYVDELEYFINCVKTGQRPLINNIQSAINTLKVVLAAKESAKESRTIYIN